MARPALACSLALLLLGGCLSEPFSTPDHSSTEPFSDTEPLRLTFNVGIDQMPAWLPDGSALIYSFERPRIDPVRDRDHCLAVLPASGGRITQTICWPETASDDRTIDRAYLPAVTEGGRLAYAWRRTTTPATSDEAAGIVVTALSDPRQVEIVLSLPHIPEGGTQLRDELTQLAWVSPDTLLASDTTGRYVFVDLTHNPATLSPFDVGLPIRSAAPSDTDPAIFYTVIDTMLSDAVDETRLLYRYDLATRERSVAYELPGSAADLSVSGNRIAALILLGFQSEIHVVDLLSGQDIVVSEPFSRYSGPALSPDGTHLVVESVPVGMNSPPDLLLWEVP